MIIKNMKKAIVYILLSGLMFGSFLVRAEVLDTIIAVVEDDVILDRELQKEVTVIEQRILASKSEIPPSSV
ncbi:MAG: molecular chaperone SurA, partial [Methylobacter sp.]